MLNWPVYIKTEKHTHLAIYKDGRHILISKLDSDNGKTFTLSFGIHPSIKEPGVDIFVNRMIELHTQIEKDEFEEELRKIDIYFQKFHDGWIDVLIEEDNEGNTGMGEITGSEEEKYNELNQEIENKQQELFNQNEEK